MKMKEPANLSLIENLSFAICGLNVHHRWSLVKSYETKKHEYRYVWKCSRCRQRVTNDGGQPTEFDGVSDPGSLVY